MTKTSDSNVYLIDTKSDRQFDLTRYQITSVAFSPNGLQLAAASSDNDVHLFDCQTGQLLRSLRGHDSEVRSVAFSPDGRYLASGSANGAVRLWNVRLRQLQASLVDENMPISCIRFSPNGSILAIAVGSWMSDNGQVSVLDVAARKRIAQFEGSAPIGALAFHPDGKLLAIEWSGQVIMWNPVDKASRIIGAINKDTVSSIAFSPDHLLLELMDRRADSSELLTRR